MHLTPLPGVERRQFTAVDVVSRHGVVGVRSCATAGTATAFLAELQPRTPFPIRAIQVDGGSEFMAEFEAACASADDRAVRLAAPLAQAQWPGRTPQRHRAPRVLGAL